MLEYSIFDLIIFDKTNSKVYDTTIPPVMILIYDLYVILITFMNILKLPATHVYFNIWILEMFE